MRLHLFANKNQVKVLNEKLKKLKEKPGPVARGKTFIALHFKKNEKERTV